MTSFSQASLTKYQVDPPYPTLPAMVVYATGFLPVLKGSHFQNRMLHKMNNK